MFIRIQTPSGNLTVKLHGDERSVAWGMAALHAQHLAEMRGESIDITDALEHVREAFKETT